MRRIQLIGLAAAVALASAGPARADDHERGEKGEQAGGVAGEKRSEQAGENSNPQWSDDATRGQDRADERRRAEEERAEKQRKEKQHKEKQRKEKGGSRSGGGPEKGKH